MSLGIGSEEGRSERSASSLPAHVGEERDSARAPAGFRESYLSRRNTLIGGLGKCFEDGTLLGQILQELPVISSLPQNFQFSDALRYDPTHESGDSSPIVGVLKSTISERIKVIAKNADGLCDSPEAKTRYMDRLARQFNTMLTHLIEEEREGCALKVEALCARVDTILSHFEGETVCDLGQRVEELRRLGISLRRYSGSYLETNAESPSTIELLSARPGLPAVIIPLKEFFDRFNSGIVELLNSISEQSAA